MFAVYKDGTTTVFESVILHRLEKYLWTTDNQFGFKSGHSTGHVYVNL